MKKQSYIKPAMRVVPVRTAQMLCGSPGVKSLSTPDDDVDLHYEGQGFGSDILDR